jgi:hypothetical protein
VFLLAAPSLRAPTKPFAGNGGGAAAAADDDDDYGDF